MKKVVLIAAVLAAMCLASVAQAESSLVGLMQTWWSYTAYTHPDSSDADATQTGFGVRRARVGYKYKGEDMTGSFLGDMSGSYFRILDAYIDYKFHEKASLRAGRFIGAQSKAAGLTSSTRIDLVERTIVGRRFGAGTVGGDYRTFGAQLTMVPNDMFTVKILAHNGNGDWSTDFLPSNNGHGDPTHVTMVDSVTTIASPTLRDTGAMPQLDFGVDAKPMDELELGFTYGLPNEFRNKTGSMSAFAYYTVEEYYFKFDFAQLMHNPDWDDDDLDYTSMGYAVTGGYSANENTEVVARYESWDNDTDADTEDGDYLTKNLSFGVNYYVNPEAKYDQVFKAAFTLRMDDTPAGVDIPDPYLFQLMWQIFVH